MVGRIRENLREMKGKKRNQTGFTLIELMIVVAILAILAAIAIPEYMKYVRKAAVSRVETSLSACVSAALADWADSGATSYTCNLDNSTHVGSATGGNTVTITVNSDGTLPSNALGQTTFYVDGHGINCSLDTNSKTVTCSSAQ